MTSSPSEPHPDKRAELEFATIDLDRKNRCGLPEVIFGQGKTADQIVAIAQKLIDHDQPVLATRLSPEATSAMQKAFPDVRVNICARTCCLGQMPELPGKVTVCCAGTTDLPVAQEAAEVTAFFGNSVDQITDVGVAGLHRLLARLDTLRSSDVIIAVAGMEGALPSVIGGLVDLPVIAVPTSVGYGANMQGLTALCGMLTSCSSGVTVVNIDNGFGAAYAATQIIRLVQRHGGNQSRTAR